MWSVGLMRSEWVRIVHNMYNHGLNLEKKNINKKQKNNKNNSDDWVRQIFRKSLW